MNRPQILCSAFILFVFVLLAGCSSNIDKQALLEPLIPERHGWDLKQLTIADTDNNVLEFKRVACVWVVGDDNEQSDESRVTDLADKLVSVTPTDLTTIKSDRYEDFKVGDANFSRKATLTFKDNSSFTLLVGSPGLTKPAYIRLAGKKEVYRVDEPLFKQINLDPDSWLASKEG